MIQGTGSGVGKSVLVSAFCRILLQDGYNVAPFKSQNMALNSFVTEDGAEIGRAQASQAVAAKLKPTADMNPILIKPTADRSAQIILQGKPVKNMSVYEYKKYKTYGLKKVMESYKRLANEFEVITIEGAGSPAEINLKEHDIVNMKTAEFTDSPVILVGDIDKGGVFAWLVGTLELLSEDERKRVKGFIINKFRGDKRLLKSGITFLEKYTDKKVLGVIPYFKEIKIPEEDSIPLESKRNKSNNHINIGVVSLPHISNFTDFDALEQEPDVKLKYIRNQSEIKDYDLIIIPGTKSSIGDFTYLKRKGFVKEIISLYKSDSNIMIAGICGGYQILGEKIYDKESVESKSKETSGMGIIPVTTMFSKGKILSQVKAKEIETGIELKGYEIHHGKTKLNKNLNPMFKITKNGKTYTDGAITDDKRCWGTYIHGLFDNDKFRRKFLNNIRKRKGLPVIKKGNTFNPDKEFDKLAKLVRKNINMNLFYDILFNR